MLTKQAEIIAIAQETQGRAHEAYFEKHSSHAPTEFPIGSYVLVNYGENGPPNKLHQNWKGPYRVVNHDDVNKNRYTVQNIVTDKLEDFPNKQLKLFIHDEDGLSPLDVAMRDEGYDIVEKIISHKPKNLNSKTPKGKIFFNIKYIGDTKTYNDVPYTTLRDNEVLHTYLEKNNLKSLIPTKYTWGKKGPQV